MPIPRFRSLLLFCLLSLAGCRSYVVVQCSAGPYLLPPGLESPDLTFTVQGVARRTPFEVASKYFALTTGVHRYFEPVSVLTIRRSLIVQTEGTIAKRCKSIAASDDAVRADFVSFRKTLEKAEIAGHIKPRGAERIAARIAELVPAPPASALFYHYGFAKQADKRATIDLLPGMRVRLEHGLYQLDPEALSSGSPTQAQGYIGTGSSYFSIQDFHDDTATPRRYVDAFTGTLRGMGALETQSAPPRLTGAAEIDLAVRRFLRVIYPTTLWDSTKINPDLPGQRPLLVVAETYCGLAEPAVDCTKVAPDSPTLLGRDRLFFRARSLPIPEIAVTINGEQQYVPVGTTLRNVIRRTAVWSEWEIAQRVRLRRRAGTRMVPVRFRTEDSAAVDLPLVGGDDVSW